jgi:hypothetical protein
MFVVGNAPLLDGPPVNRVWDSPGFLVRIIDELVAGAPKGQEVPVEVLDEYLEVVTEGRKL